MKPYSRQYYLQKLRKLLSRADDEMFVKMIWAADALQNGRSHLAADFLQFPSQAATTDYTSPFKVHEWELETLMNELFITDNRRVGRRKTRTLDTTNFNTLLTLARTLRQLENAESGIYLHKIDIHKELHRLAQRQFPWQRKYASQFKLFRSVYVFGSSLCSEYFQESFQITVQQLLLLGAALEAKFQRSAIVSRPRHIPELHLDAVTTEAGLKLISASVSEVRHQALDQRNKVTKSIKGWQPISYMPSVLRVFPIISFGPDSGRLLCPLHKLIITRVTSGLYQDIVKGGPRVINEIGIQFEQYSLSLMRSLLPALSVRGAYRYGTKKRSYDSPDILVGRRDQLLLAVECKASKLTFGAQFSGNPIEEQGVKYDEIANGVHQIWRYFSHLRRGIATGELHGDACGMVLTLDPWLTMSRTLQQEVYKRAKDLSTRDFEISEEDQRPVLFCPIQDLEVILPQVNDIDFLTLLKAATEDRFSGWMLPKVIEQMSLQRDVAKEFPFQMEDVLPWWNAATTTAPNE